MKRKVLSVVLAAAMVFSMAACGNNDSGNGGNSGNTGSSESTSSDAPSNSDGGAVRLKRLRRPQRIPEVRGRSWRISTMAL